MRVNVCEGVDHDNQDRHKSPPVLAKKAIEVKLGSLMQISTGVLVIEVNFRFFSLFNFFFVLLGKKEIFQWKG